MARRLATAVHVGGHVFKAGDAPPKEIAEQITNPKAWATDADQNDADVATESQDGDVSEGDTPHEDAGGAGGDDADQNDADVATESQDSQPRSRRRNK